MVWSDNRTANKWMEKTVDETCLHTMKKIYWTDEERHWNKSGENVAGEYFMDTSLHTMKKMDWADEEKHWNKRREAAGEYFVETNVHNMKKIDRWRRILKQEERCGWRIFPGRGGECSSNTSGSWRFEIHDDLSEYLHIFLCVSFLYIIFMCFHFWCISKYFQHSFQLFFSSHFHISLNMLNYKHL